MVAKYFRIQCPHFTDKEKSRKVKKRKKKRFKIARCGTRTQISCLLIKCSSL